MIFKKISFIGGVFFLLFTPIILANELINQSDQKILIWNGPKNSEIFEHLQENSLKYEVQLGGSEGIEVRPSNSSNFIEVKNKKTQKWISVKIPYNKNTNVINTNRLINSIFSTSDCDNVQTKIILSKSTPNAKVYFNTQPIGIVEPNGRFYFKSGGVCINTKVNLLFTKVKCVDYSSSFIPVENPHEYHNSVKLNCKQTK